MRKLVTVLVVALAAASVASAQPAPWGAPPWGQAQAQTVTVEGKLALINGTIGVQSGGKTYYTPMIGRLIGFVDAIKEGASVKIEGYERPLPSAPETSMLAVTKLTVAGKDYDLGRSAGMGPGMHGGMRGGPRW
jgi:hypothetical protein